MQITRQFFNPSMMSAPLAQPQTGVPSQAGTKALAQGLEDAGKAIGQVALTMRKARQDSDLAQFRVNAEKSLAELDQSFEQDTDYANVGKKWEDQVKAQQDSLTSGIEDPETKKKAALDYELLAIRHRAAFTSHTTQRETAFRKAQFENNFDWEVSKGIQAPDDATRANKQAEFDRSADAMAPWAGKDYAEKMKGKYISDVSLGRAESLIQQDPEAALKALSDDPSWYRPDGTRKGLGFLGILKSKSGKDMTEYSIGLEIHGKEMDVPSIVPGLTKDEIEYIKNEGDFRENTPLVRSIVRKAKENAEKRLDEGKSVFAGPEDYPEGTVDPNKDQFPGLDTLLRLKLRDKAKTKATEYAADDEAQRLIGVLKSGARTESQIEDEINALPDLEMKKAVRAAFRPYAAEWKRQVREAETDAIWNASTTLDTMAGDLPGQFKYVQGLPKGSKQRKVAEARYAHYASAGGVSPMTDPEQYMAAQDAMRYGEITNAKQIPEKYPGIMRRDIDRLDAELKSTQKPMEKLRSAYLLAQGGDRVKSAGDYASFEKTALETLQETNRGNDPGFVQGLADRWFLRGETPTNSKLFIGYGRDKAFREAVSDSAWLPDIVSDSDKQTRPDSGVPNALILTKSRADSIPSIPSWNAWLKRAGGDAELAKRMYWKKYIESTLGKRQRSAAQGE